jgi:hypothetical protein
MIGAIGLLAFVVFSACGGNGGDGGNGGGRVVSTPSASVTSGIQLSLQEYFQQFDALLDDYTRRQRATNDELAGAWSTMTQLELRKKLLTGFLEKFAANAQGYLQELGKLVPPPEVEELHGKFSKLFTEGAKVFEDYIDQVAEVQSEEQFDDVAQGFGQELEKAGKRVDDACFALQASAEENRIDVKLACGGGQAD